MINPAIGTLTHDYGMAVGVRMRRHRVRRPHTLQAYGEDVAGYAGFNWFGLVKKKKKLTPEEKQDKVEAKQQATQNQAIQRERTLQNAKGAVATEREKAIQSNGRRVLMVVSAVGVVALVGTVLYLKRKKRKKKK